MDLNKFNDNKIVKSLIGVMIGVFILTICSVSVGYLPFDLHTHGNLDWGISLMLEFYIRGNIEVATLSWYLLTVIIFVVSWKLSDQISRSWKRTLFRICLATILLTPGVFVNPPPSFSAALANPTIYGDPSADYVIFPAVVGIVKYFLYSPLTHQTLSVVALLFWPIPAIIFIMMFLIVVRIFTTKENAAI